MKAQEKKGQLRRIVPRLADAIPRQPDTDVVWQAFEAAIADVLQALEEDEYLIIGSKHRQHYVQFAGEGVHGMRAEAVSNAYICDPAEYLSDVQHEQIAHVLDRERQGLGHLIVRKRFELHRGLSLVARVLPQPQHRGGGIEQPAH